ncbi:MAG: DUF1460 domain-containing protein [Bacteriovoracaceae bacterium]|nr:DUF1460 domain-containing protein [Bacteriovoracaceae bacterium]
MLKILVLLYISVMLVPFQAYSATSVSEILDKISSYDDTSTRIEKASELLIGGQYASGPLGEGADGEYDQFPLYRLDVFDCTTFVETVMAFAISKTNLEFHDNLLRIRYRDGVISFASRNHFPSLDWIPNNEWLLFDLTEKVAGLGTRLGSGVINKSGWYKKLSRGRIRLKRYSDETDGEYKNRVSDALEKVRMLGEGFEPELALIPYVSWDALYSSTTLSKIPHGAVISVVRPGWNLFKFLKIDIGTNINISHQGIAIWKDGVLYFRHSSSKSKKVVDSDFLEYMRIYINSPTATGLNILKVH